MCGDRVGDRIQVGEAVYREVPARGNRSRQPAEHRRQDRHRGERQHDVPGQLHRVGSRARAERAVSELETRAATRERHAHVRAAVGTGQELRAVRERADDRQSHAHPILAGRHSLDPAAAIAYQHVDAVRRDLEPNRERSVLVTVGVQNDVVASLADRCLEVVEQLGIESEPLAKA